jgi:hypothetical protein
MRKGVAGAAVEQPENAIVGFGFWGGHAAACWGRLHLCLLGLVPALAPGPLVGHTLRNIAAMIAPSAAAAPPIAHLHGAAHAVAAA